MHDHSMVVHTGDTKHRHPLEPKPKGEGTHGGKISAYLVRIIFAGFNVRGFRGSTAIREYFVREYLDITVNGPTQLEPINDVMRNKNGDNWLRGKLASLVPLFPTRCSCCRQTCLFVLTWYPSATSFQSWRRLFLHQRRRSVQQEVEITTLVAAAAAKRIGGHGVDEKGPIWQDHHRDSESKDHQVRIPLKMALQQPHVI